MQADDAMTLVAIFALKGKKGVDKDADSHVRQALPKLAAGLRSVWVADGKGPAPSAVSAAADFFWAM